MVSQRRMPGGQGPARGGARASAAGARPSSRGWLRGQRVARSEAAPRAGWRATAGDYRTLRTDSARHTDVRRPARRTRAPRPPRRVSGRAVALGLLLLALTLSYAYPLRVYLAQQAQIDRMESAQQEQRKRIQELADRVARWNDDEYVIAQARSRLQLVRAGERVYVVGVDAQPATGTAEGAHGPWYQQLWSSVQTADDPPVR